ncbi:MAG: hypothetical protein ACREE7_07125 [Dongiaceae bacterium]
MIGKGGFRIIGLVALSAAAAGCTAQQKSQQSQPQAPQQAVAMPADLQTAVLDAELWGHALYDSYTAPNVGNDKAVERAIETVHQSVKDHCTGTYRAVAVVPPSATKDRIVIYDIGEAPASQAIMLGRHYRVETTLDGKGVLLGEPSTTGCVTLPPVTGNAMAPSAVTHDLSPAPNEYHVFFSLMYGRSLEVVTQAGHWLVEHGKISYIGRS